MGSEPPPAETDPEPNPEGPTELVETDSGELVERLSAGTATLLLIWLVMIGAGTALVGAWLVYAIVFGTRLGLGAFVSDLGFYVAVYGAIGPTVLWLTGRAQGHNARWFVWTAIRIGLFMGVLTVAFGALLISMLGAGLEATTIVLAVAVLAVTLVISVAWGLATWAADRWIAQARMEGPEG